MQKFSLAFQSESFDPVFASAIGSFSVLFLSFISKQDNLEFQSCFGELFIILGDLLLCEQNEYFDSKTKENFKKYLKYVSKHFSVILITNEKIQTFIEPLVDLWMR